MNNATDPPESSSAPSDARYARGSEDQSPVQRVADLWYAKPRRSRSLTRGAFALLGLGSLIAATWILKGTGTRTQTIYTKANAARAALLRTAALPSCLEAYFQEVGYYPADLEDLYRSPASMPFGKAWPGSCLTNRDFLLDPWGERWNYVAGRSAIHHPGAYDLWSSGPDLLSGNADDICNW